MNQLRPLSLGEILDRTAELYRSRFGLFAGIAAIFAGMMLVVQFAHFGVMWLIGYPHIPPYRLWMSGVASVVQGLADLLIAGVAIAAITRALAWIYLGHEATVRSAVESVKPRLGRYLWLMTMAGFKAWAPMAVLYCIMIGVAVAAFRAGSLGHAGAAPAVNPGLIEAGIGFLILAPLMLAGSVYGVWMSLRLSLGTSVCVVEDLPARQSLRRSVELSKGTLGRILVLGILVVCIRLLVDIVLSAPTLIWMFKSHFRTLSLWVLTWQQIAEFITNMLILPVYGAGLTLFYYDERIRKEGFDIEWMMQAAGMSQLPAAVAAQSPSTTVES